MKEIIAEMIANNKKLKDLSNEEFAKLLVADDSWVNIDTKMEIKSEALRRII